MGAHVRWPGADAGVAGDSVDGDGAAPAPVSAAPEAGRARSSASSWQAGEWPRSGARGGQFEPNGGRGGRARDGLGSRGAVKGLDCAARAVGVRAGKPWGALSRALRGGGTVGISQGVGAVRFAAHPRFVGEGAPRGRRGAAVAERLPTRLAATATRRAGRMAPPPPSGSPAAAPRAPFPRPRGDRGSAAARGGPGRQPGTKGSQACDRAALQSPKELSQPGKGGSISAAGRPSHSVRMPAMADAARLAWQRRHRLRSSTAVWGPWTDGRVEATTVEWTEPQDVEHNGGGGREFRLAHNGGEEAAEVGG